MTRTKFTMEDAIKTIERHTKVTKIVWGKEFHLAIFFTAPYEGGLMKIDHGQIIVIENFYNQEEMLQVIGRLAM